MAAVSGMAAKNGSNGGISSVSISTCYVVYRSGEKPAKRRENSENW